MKAKITAVIEVRFGLSGMPPGEFEAACPTLEIEYDFRAGSPAVYYQRNGDPGWPEEAAELELISAKLIDGDGLAPTQEQVDDWAERWLDEEGYGDACANCEDDGPDPDDLRDRQRDDRLTA